MISSITPFHLVPILHQLLSFCLVSICLLLFNLSSVHIVALHLVLFHLFHLIYFWLYNQASLKFSLVCSWSPSTPPNWREFRAQSRVSEEDGKFCRWRSLELRKRLSPVFETRHRGKQWSMCHHCSSLFPRFQRGQKAPGHAPLVDYWPCWELCQDR